MRHSRTVVAMIGLFAATVGTPAAARAGPPGSTQTSSPFYQLVDLGTFGGPNSAETQEFPFVSNRGTVVGYADTATPDDTDEGFTFHAFRWRHGVLTDLGTLPGGANSVANVVNNHDVAAGSAETGRVDPDGRRESVAVKWTKDGRLVPLGTLGADFGFAAAINDHGQIVGPTANAVPDPSSLFGWPTQTRAFLWQDGVMRDIGTLGGPDAAAFFINDHAQVAGFSYTGSAPDPATGDRALHPFLWQRGRMADIGTLGGTFGAPNDLNDRGQVVGISTTAGNAELHPFLWRHGAIIDLGTFGGTFGTATAINDAGEVAGAATTATDTTHAFLWRTGAMTDLGTVGADRCSEAHFMNAKGQVTGTSGGCDQNRVIEEHGFLWQKGGRMIDLNAFVPPGSDLTVTDGETINDRGEIAGTGRLPNGDFHAILLRPCAATAVDRHCRS